MYYVKCVTNNIEAGLLITCIRARPQLRLGTLIWRRIKMKKGLILITVLFVITACGPSAKPQPVLDEEFVAQAIEEGIEVTFYGDRCTDIGMVVLPEGEYTLAFKDMIGKGTADLHVSQLVDGHTYQDLLDLQGGDLTNWNVDPEYHTLANHIDTDFDISAGIKRVTFALEEGEHAVYILNVKPEGVVTEQFYCFPLMIVDDPSK